jgi:stage V sporulation protein R
MVNCGDPFIVVVEGDYRKRRELYLQHIYDGRELDISYLEKTLPYIFSLWRRPVHLETVVRDGKEKVVFTCSDGSNIEHSKA